MGAGLSALLGVGDVASARRLDVGWYGADGGTRSGKQCQWHAVAPGLSARHSGGSSIVRVVE